MFREILVPLDLSDEHSWQKALPAAIKMCEAFGAGLHLLTVVPEFGLPMVGQYFPEGYEAKLRSQVAQQLREFTAAHVPDGIRCQRIVAEGKVYQEILRAAEKVPPISSSWARTAPELRDFLLGPNAAKAVRHARVSVMVVRQ